MDLIVTGRIVDAVEAERIGLVHAIAEGKDPVAIGAEYAERFIGFGLQATKIARQAVQRASVSSLDEGLSIEADLITLAFGTADANEGMQAFLDKREAKFTDA